MSDNLITRAGKALYGEQWQSELAPAGLGYHEGADVGGGRRCLRAGPVGPVLGPRGRYGTVSGADELRHLCIFAEIGDNNGEAS